MAPVFRSASPVPPTSSVASDRARRSGQHRSPYRDGSDRSPRRQAMLEHDDDCLIRHVSTWADRRRVVTGITATLLASISWRGANHVSAQEQIVPGRCTQDAQCQTGGLGPCVGATCEEGSCTFFSVDCVRGYVCCGNGACCVVDASGSCSASADCAQPRSHQGHHCRNARCVEGTCRSRRCRRCPSYHLPTASGQRPRSAEVAPLPTAGKASQGGHRRKRHYRVRC
jgi:hypothetical protein